MVEFVVKEGPMFEAMIMNHELGNPEYNFLFENKSSIHVYYRWKLFSVLQGESTKEWSLKPFRMFKGGSIWLPPRSINYQAGMPDELINEANEDKSTLSDNQCDRLIELIQNLTLTRDAIAEGMVFCLNHLSAIVDSLDIIFDSLGNKTTKPPAKIARLYLLHDVLINCTKKEVTILNLKDKLDNIIEHMIDYLATIKEESDERLFCLKVARVLEQWKDKNFLSEASIKMYEDNFSEFIEIMDEGNSSSDEPLDGASLLKRSLKGSCDVIIPTPSSLKTKQEIKIRQEYFVPSKWDTIDQEELEATSMTSTKMYYMNMDQGDSVLEAVKKPENNCDERSPVQAKSPEKASDKRSKRYSRSRRDSDSDREATQSEKSRSRNKRRGYDSSPDCHSKRHKVKRRRRSNKR